MPGPACYETGGVEATITDAHLMLGRLPEVLAGGTLNCHGRPRTPRSLAWRRIADSIPGAWPAGSSKSLPNSYVRRFAACSPSPGWKQAGSF